jgi:hypothetical protein
VCLDIKTSPGAKAFLTFMKKQLLESKSHETKDWLRNTIEHFISHPGDDLPRSLWGSADYIGNLYYPSPVDIIIWQVQSTDPKTVFKPLSCSNKMNPESEDGARQVMGTSHHLVLHESHFFPIDSAFSEAQCTSIISSLKSKIRSFVTKERPLAEPLCAARSEVKSHGDQGLPNLPLDNAKVSKVRGDGHCLYSALGRGSLNINEDLRQTICDEILHNPDKIAYRDVSYANDVRMNFNKSIDDYISVMRRTDGSMNSYGGDLEIHAFCHLKGLSVVVYCMQNNTYTPKNVHHDNDDSPTICLLYQGKDGSAHFDLLLLSDEAEVQLAEDLSAMNLKKENISLMHNESRLNEVDSLSSSTSCNKGDDYLYCVRYVVTKNLLVNDKLYEEVCGLIRDVAYGLEIKTEIQISKYDLGVYKLLSNDSHSVSLTGWIEGNSSMTLGLGEVYLVSMKEKICLLAREDNRPKKILVNKTNSNTKSRGGSNVYITIYGVPTQLVR